MSDIVERLRAAANGHPAAEISWPHRVLHDAADEIERLRARLAEAERDAARYRWLRKAREHWDVLHREDEDAYWQDLAGNELDAAIDAAMAAT